MRKLLFTLSIATGFALMMIVTWLASPTPCYACGNQIVQTCSANLSSVTLHKGDTGREWWQVFPAREENTTKVYLAINNTSFTPAPYEYEIKVSGDWDPNSVGKGITPAQGAGTLGMVGTSNDANKVIEIAIPYRETFTGDLVITATVKSVNSASPASECNFAITGQPKKNSSTITTKLRIDSEAPTVWPVLPATCPLAAEKPMLRFGVRNYSGQSQTYNVFARVLNANGQSDKDFFTVNGQNGIFTASQNNNNREVQLDTMTLNPWETKLVKLTCETFGYCVPGATNQVNLRVKSASSSGNQFEANATSGLTIRDPNTKCPETEDWGTMMPPWLAGTLAGLTTLIGGYLSCTALTAMFSLNGNDGAASWAADHCVWIWPLAVGAAIVAATYGYIF